MRFVIFVMALLVASVLVVVLGNITLAMGFVGTVMPFLAAWLAQTFLESPSLAGALGNISKARDAYNKYTKDENARKTQKVEQGACLEIYSHYVGLAAQLLVGLATAFMAVFFMSSIPTILTLVTFAIVYTFIIGVVLRTSGDKLSPMSEYLRQYPDKWRSHENGLPPLKAPLIQLRLFVLILGLVVSVILGYLPQDPPESAKPAITQSVPIAVHTPTPIAPPSSKGLKP